MVLTEFFSILNIIKQHHNVSVQSGVQTDLSAYPCIIIKGKRVVLC